MAYLYVGDDDDDYAYLLQQQQAFAEFEETKRRRIDDLESQELAQAFAESEHEWIQSTARSEQEAEDFARFLYNDEIQEVDQEIAKALEDSKCEYDNQLLHDHLVKQQVSDNSDRNTGRWDCPICTFTNAPYKQQCAMCHSPPPLQVLAFSLIPDIRFGLEIEILVPNGRRDGYTLKTIARCLSKQGHPKVECRGCSKVLSPSHDWKTSDHRKIEHRQCHESSSSAAADAWIIKTDRSLQSGVNDLSFELVSPVLQGEVGLGELRHVMEHLRVLGIATNNSCGFHVHVDASKGTTLGSLTGMQQMCRSFLALENAFDLLVALSWETTNQSRRTNQNRYCQSNRLNFGEMSNRQRWDRISNAQNFRQLVPLISPDRYRKLNLTNILNRDRPSTCEFRYHGGVEVLNEAEAWVRLLLRFCEQTSTCTSQHNNSISLLHQGAIPKDEVRALFDILNCSGLEQYFMVDRRLFSDDRLQNPWACTICRIVFQDSRSLSQHAAATKHQQSRRV